MTALRVGIAAAAAIAALAAPWLIDNQFALLMISASGIVYLAAIGLNLVMGFAGQVSLGHAALIGVGAYASAILTSRYEQPFLVGLLAGALLAGLVGLLLGIPSLRLAGPYLAMATMAFNIILQRLMVNWSFITGGPDGLPGLPGASIGPLLFDRRTFIYLVAAFVLGGLFVAHSLVKSRYGRALLAIREDELAGSSLGVDLYRGKLLAFGLSAVYAGVAGSLFAHLYRHISPISFGLESSLELLLAVILGGPGSLVWPAVGAAIVTVLPQLPALQNLQELRLLVYGSLLLASVMVFRQGLAGAFGRRRSTLTPTLSHGERGPGPNPQPPTPNPQLVLEQVSRSFGGVKALDGVDLTVRTGTIHGLIGANGSGKTTALNVISGIHRAEAGRVTFAERSLEGLPPHEIARLGLGRTFQNLRLFRELSVLQNIQAGQHVWLKSPLLSSLFNLASSRQWEQRSQREAESLAARLGLDDVLGLQAEELPHGKQRRLELARALAAKPRILLLDEPAAGLSGAEIAELKRLLREARESGLTILLVEHHLELVLELCDRVTVLDHGRVIADGSPAEVRADAAVARAYLGVHAGDAEGPAVASPAPEVSGHTILELRGMSVRYGHVEVVSGLDLRVGAGEIVVLLGANGAGKSTVLRAISGLVPLSGGAISYEGLQLGHLPAYRRSGLGLAHVPEGRLVFADQTIEDNLRLGAFHRYFRSGKAEIEADLQRMLLRFPALAERRELAAGSLSGGEQQQLAIARALMARPRLLLLDEPSLGLAPMLVDQVFELIGALRREGVTILLVEQLAYRALELADRAYVLQNGRRALSGPASALARDPRLEAAYLGS